MVTESEQPLMPARWWPGRQWLGYLAAVLLVGAALLVRLGLGFAHGTPPMLLLLIIPIMFAAYLGGLRAGLLATVLAALASDYFLLSPRHSLWIDHPANRIQWVMLWAVGLMISLLCEALHRSRERLVQDLADRQRVEEQRQQFVSLAENSHEFIGMCDAQFRPFFINAAGMRMVGLDDFEQALRTPVREFFFPEDQAFILEQFFPQVLQNGHGEVEIRFRHFKTGEPLWMIYAVFALADASGKPSGLATVSRNIGERKRAEEELRQARDELEMRVQERTADLTAPTPNWNGRNKRPKPPAAPRAPSWRT